MFLLDTNTCIRVLNGSSAPVAARLQATSPSEVRLSAVVKADNTREFGRITGLRIEDWEAAGSNGGR